MMNKNKWIILISVVVVVILTVVLLIAMLGGDGIRKEQPGDNNGTGDTSAVADSSDTTPSDTTPSDTTPTDTTPEPTEDKKDNQSKPNKAPTPDSEDKEIEVEIDTGDEEFTDNMVIDFDDLLAAAGK